MENEKNIGATGEYPHGKYNTAEEGELAVAVTADKDNNRVLLKFGKPIAWIAMTAEQAEGFGDLLRQKAAELDFIIPDAENQEIFSGAMEQMFGAPSRAPVKFELSIPLAVGLISQLHLAFRHPLNTGPTREHLEKLVRELIERIDPGRGDLHKLLMRGFNPAYDE